VGDTPRGGGGPSLCSGGGGGGGGERERGPRAGEGGGCAGRTVIEWGQLVERWGDPAMIGSHDGVETVGGCARLRVGGRGRVLLTGGKGGGWWGMLEEIGSAGYGGGGSRHSKNV